MLILLQHAHYRTNPNKYGALHSIDRKDGPLAHEHVFVRCYPGVANIPTDIHNNLVFLCLPSSDLLPQFVLFST